MLGLMEGKLGENHSGELHRETAEQKASRIISEEMSRLGWKETDLVSRLKNHPDKLVIATRVRKETTLSIRWIAARLQMGTYKSVKSMLHERMHADERPAKSNAPCTQLQLPQVRPTVS